jgi:phosphomannomutase
MSGHIFFVDGYYGFDDAVYVAVRLLGVLSRSPESLAELDEDTILTRRV